MNINTNISQSNAVEKTVRSRFMLGLILSALSGIMVLLSFPPYGVWWLVWIAFVPSVFAQYRLFPQKWSSLGPSLLSLFWLGPFLARLFGTEFGPFFTYLGVLIAILNLFLATERKFHDQTGYRWFVLHGVVGWVGFEMVRATFIPLIATSAFIGYTQASQAWLIQPVSVFSVYGLNIVIMVVNYAIAQGVITWFDNRWQQVDAVPVSAGLSSKWIAIAGVIGSLWIGLSVIMLNMADKNAPTVKVAALRSGFSQPAFLDDGDTSDVRFETIGKQARDAADQGAKILYTSEMMFNFNPQEEYAEDFRTLARETDAYIFISYAVVKEGQEFRNEAVLLTPAGEFLDVYAKNHVPPGEPASPVIGLFPVYDTPHGRLATFICHDGNYTDISRKLVLKGAQIVAAPYREFTGFGEQLWTNVTFRAVENNTSMIITGASTVAAIIDPYGRQLQLDVDPSGSSVTLVGDVSLGSGPTFYSRSGDVLGWICFAGFIFFIVFQMIVDNREKKVAMN